jgi:hypothetical protein
MSDFTQATAVLEPSVNELDLVNGGTFIGDIVDGVKGAIHHVETVIRFYTGTIKDIATELP